MRPKTVSATSLEVYRGCPTRFLAENVNRKPRTPLAGPAMFGVALHAALDKYIERTHDPETGLILPEISGAPYGNVPELLGDIWEAAARYYCEYQDPYVAEGHELLKRWAVSRENPVKVLSRELKEHFEVAVPGYEETQTVTYICDRIDRDPETDLITIYDYKSQWVRTDPEKMRTMFQPALYALAMHHKYGVDKVAVTYDMLRYEEVTIIFNLTQMMDFQDYLSSVCRKIWDDERPTETVNTDCRYCVRRDVCKSFKQATELRWTPTLTVSEVAERRAMAKDAMKGLEVTLRECDEFLLQEMRDQDSPVVATDDHVVYGKQSKQTIYDPGVVYRVLGDDAIPFMKVQKTVLDKELRRKNGRFTPAQRQEIEDLSIVTFGNTTVDVKQEEAA